MSHTIAPVLGEATVQELREAVRGEILTPADGGYAEASRIWNGAHQSALLGSVRAPGTRPQRRLARGRQIPGRDPRGAGNPLPFNAGSKLKACCGSLGLRRLFHRAAQRRLAPSVRRSPWP